MKRSLICLTTAVLIFGLIGCQIFRPAQYTVKRVSDGDTLTVSDPQGTDIKVRFACVDAPEVPHTAKERASKRAVVRAQFQWGMQAQNRVQQLVKQGGERVNLIITDSDRYGRKVSEVRLSDGTLIQEVLVREGLALVYRPYLKDCPSAAIVEQAEAEAKQQQRGVWSYPKFLQPWEYRKRNK
ncbi:MAG: thermonuclease family protein [Gloeocapsa sp. UFS-A4-WI-NPMV-4B04]|nr:thermonuclease family protein [Gloeocapsa sp. UFS-A4-WI-NPMV-4B04]